MADDRFGKFKQLARLTAETQDALDDDRLARRDERHISKLQTFVHFWALVWRSFVRNRCPLRASGLAYGSLLAMVPMLAVVISVSASLLHRQGEEPIQRFIDTMVERLTPEADSRQAARFLGPPVPGSPEAGATNLVEGAEASAGAGLFDPEEYARTRKEVALQIKEFVGNIRSGALTATGMVALLFVAIGMLTRIEDTFNDIWGVTRGRSWMARVTHYWGAITLGPIVVAVTFTLTTGPYFEATKRFVASLGPLGAWAVTGGMAALPYVIWSLAFTLFYQLMPNTRVRWGAALVGGLVGGCLWQMNSEFSVLYVSRVVTNSRIYGSIAVVPVFMIGLYVAWIILLFGAQVSYAWQNRRTYLQERQAESVHQEGREFVALRLATHVARRFREAAPPPTANELAAAIGAPTRLVVQILASLVSAKHFAELSGPDPAYVPARPLDRITARDILSALRVGTGMDLVTREDEAREIVRAEYGRILEASRAVAAQLTLEDLVARIPKPSRTTPAAVAPAAFDVEDAPKATVAPTPSA